MATDRIDRFESQETQDDITSVTAKANQPFQTAWTSALDISSWIAPNDGFVRMYFNPSSASGGQALYRIDGQACGVSAKDGNGVSTCLPIRKGGQIVKINETGGSTVFNYLGL